MICEKEKVPYEEMSLSLLYDQTRRDLRHSIISMQALAAMDRGIFVSSILEMGMTGNHYWEGDWVSNTDAVGMCCSLLAEGFSLHDVQDSFLAQQQMLQCGENVDLRTLEMVSKSEKMALDNVPPFILMMDLLLEFRRLNQEVLCTGSCEKA
jgi:hypothetical protein